MNPPARMHRDGRIRIFNSLQMFASGIYLPTATIFFVKIPNGVVSSYRNTPFALSKLNAFRRA